MGGGAKCGWAAFESTPFTSIEKGNGGSGVPWKHEDDLSLPPAQLLAPASGSVLLRQGTKEAEGQHCYQPLPLLNREKSFLELYMCSCKMLVGLGWLNLHVFVLELNRLWTMVCKKQVCMTRGVTSCHGPLPRWASGSVEAGTCGTWCHPRKCTLCPTQPALHQPCF